MLNPNFESKNKKVYAIVYLWNSTKTNHAGMYFFATQLSKKYQNIELINEYIYTPEKDTFWRRLKKIIWFLFILSKLFFLVNKNSKILLFEYLGNSWQKNIARAIRFLNFKVEIISIVHLPVQFLNEAGYLTKDIASDCNLCDNLIVMGSSLKSDLQQIGVKSLIDVVPHYVDRSFYFPKHKNGNSIKIIVYGNIMRDFNLIYEIVKTINILDLEIIICLGSLADHWGFSELKNVTVYNYLPESVLLEKIQSADINLSVMSDTVGSNTIVSSMSCGLAQVCSDVGSIRDYCNDTNAVFCSNNKDAFVSSITNLIMNPGLLKKMKQSSHNISIDYDLEIISRKIYQILLLNNLK